MAERRFVIFGTGGFGRELLQPARQMLARRTADGSPPTELCFASDDSSSDAMFGIRYIAAGDIRADDEVIFAVGDGQLRRILSNRVDGRPGTLLAPTSLIGPGVEIGPGAVFCDFTMVTASARIGAHFQCNVYSYVAHDCAIGDFVTFAPRVCCNGNVIIEEGAYVGTGAVLKQGRPDKPLVIGRGAVVGMGAVVTRDVPPGATVVGNPARPLVSG
ncbi:MAG TPA: acetyltransferase [Sphingomicrobium sp.]|nr:acetyltransferase [Sphingomicrobium sp.]